jgi:hypothetical protein
MHRVVNEYNAFKLNEYQGTFEVVSGNVDSDNKFWMDWAIASEYNSEVGGSIPVKKDDGSYRNIPVKVVLGDRQKAIANLRWLLGQLGGYDPEEPSKPSAQEPSAQEPSAQEPLDNVPF